MDEAAKLAQRVQREPRDCDHWQGRCGALRHPRRQQNAAAVWLLDHKVKATPVNQSPESHDAFAGAGMMRIMDDNFKRMFLGIMSWARPAPARAGSPARSDTRRAVTIDRCSIIAYHACSTHLHWHAAMAGMYASSRASPVSSF